MLAAITLVAAAGLGALFARQRGVAFVGPDPCPIQLSKDALAPGIRAIGMASDDAGWVVGESGLIFQFRGGKWTHICGPSSRDLNAVAAVSRDEAWAVGTWGTILHYLGGRWSQVASPTQSDLRGIAMVSRDDGWAAGGNDNATLLHYARGSWSLVAVPIPAYLNGIAMVSPNDGWAVGVEHPTQPKSPSPMRSVILHYTDGTWTRVPSTGCPSLSAVAMASPSDGWALGADGFGQVCFLHYTGGQWERVSLASASAWHASEFASVSMSAADNGWAAAGALLRYTNQTWTSVSAPGLSGVLGVAVLSRDDVWATSRVRTFHYNGTSWTSIALDIPPSGP